MNQMQMQSVQPQFQWSEYSPVDAMVLKEQMQHEQNTKLQQLEAAHEKKLDQDRQHADRMQSLQGLKNQMMSPTFRGPGPQQ